MSESTITLVLTGLAGGGKGRQTNVVNEHMALAEFMNKYGKKQATFKSLSDAELAELAKTDAKAVEQHLVEKAAAFIAGATDNQAEQIVDAVCEFLVREKGFKISDSDPGSDHYYVSRGDLRPTKLDIPGDGVAWNVTAAAPFG